MEIPAALLQADGDRLFGDWSVTMTFRQVIGPGETADTSLSALLGPRSVETDSASGDLVEDIAFTVRTADLPVSPTVNHKLVYESAEYDILREESPPQGLLTILHGRRTLL